MIFYFYRFFESKPKTTLSDESGESKNEANPDLSGGDEEEKSTPPVKYCSASQNRYLYIHFIIIKKQLHKHVTKTANTSQ